MAMFWPVEGEGIPEVTSPTCSDEPERNKGACSVDWLKLRAS